MSPRYQGDRCPACGSDETTPYAIILGAAETYGYQCLACSVTWPVIQPDAAPAPTLSAVMRGTAL